MRRRLCVVLLAVGMIISQLPGVAVFADGTETPDTPAAALSGEAGGTETPDTPAASPSGEADSAETPDKTVAVATGEDETAAPAPAKTEEAEASDAVSVPVSEEPSDSKPEKGSGSETRLRSTGTQKSDVKDVYIDNTVDNSKSYVTATVHITGSGGKQVDYDTEQTVYSNEAAVTYSNPRTDQVQGMIDDAYTKAYNTANDIKKRGKTGEFHMATAQSTGRVWDNRKYTTVEDGDAVLIGDSDYLTGAYGVNEDYTRTHIASGDYGKETFFEVQADGWVSGWSITVTDDGNGTAAASFEESLAEETVSLTATPDEGYSFKEWQVISGGAELSDTSAASATFKMPYADVEIKAVFEPEHEHTKIEVSYGNASGAGANYVRGSGTPLKFVYKRSVDDDKTFGHFSGIRIDGNESGADSYTAEPGSVIVSLSPDYLDTLEAGGHTITAEFDDGNDVTVSFKVSDAAEDEEPVDDPEDDSDSSGSSGSSTGSGSGTASSSPQTGDESHPGMWAALFAACVATLAAAMRKRRA